MQALFGYHPNTTTAYRKWVTFHHEPESIYALRLTLLLQRRINQGILEKLLRKLLPCRKLYKEKN